MPSFTKVSPSFKRWSELKLGRSYVKAMVIMVQNRTKVKLFDKTVTEKSVDKTGFTLQEDAIRVRVRAG